MDNDDNTSHYHSKVVMKVAMKVFKNQKQMIIIYLQFVI